VTEVAPADRAQMSIAELRRIAQPPEVIERGSAEHWTGRLYMRRISIYGTRQALRLGWSADFVTGLMIMIGIAAVLIVSIPGLWSAVTGLLFVQLYLGLDCVDGEVARASGTTSSRGVYLDRIGHYVVEAGLMVALGVRASDGAMEPLVIGLLAALGVVMEKVETDLVAVARMSHGLGPVPEAATEITKPTLAAGRRIARLFPFHMATHAAEASMLILGAAVIDRIRGDFVASRILLVAMLAITAALVILHLVSVLNSGRLDASDSEQSQD